MTTNLCQEECQVTFKHAMMYHCKHALIVYVPAYSLLHGCVAANLARMRQCHVSHLLHTKHYATSKPQWSLGKRGVQNEAKSQ